MENAYAIAMKIADSISKKKYIDSGYAYRSYKVYEDLTWEQIREQYTASRNFDKEHQTIFEEAYKILQDVPDVPSFLRK
ncbi:hypothetical protein IT401_00990 [Candidatus Nomurabacteria bacterium]|nr:hypothetical protein [Candidatus Nomurabacteria bacterium]